LNTNRLENKTQDLIETALAFRESAALLTAIKIDLFERLGSNCVSPETLAEEEDQEGLTRLCRALAGMDLLEKKGQSFRNVGEVEQLLTSHGQFDLRPIFRHFTELYEMWGELDEALREGQSYEFDDREDDTFSEEFTEAMEARSHFAKDELVDAIGDRLNGGRLLDLGGGSGVFARALLNHDPRATGVVADQPEPLSVAQRYIEADGLSDRLETRELDLVEDDDYGSEFDVVLLSAILHIFGHETVRSILERTYDALSTGGIIVVRDYLNHDDHTGPLDGLLFDVLMYLATEEGRTYTEQELREAMAEVGFGSIERVNLPRSTDDLLIGKK
jgi:2-polyprenyl-3-methyl-5-hydroxy-6-metoxy-1,4-benzoquinol methylase